MYILDTGPLWIPAFELNGPPSENKAYSLSLSLSKAYFCFTQLSGGSAHCWGECSRVLPVVPAADSTDVLEVLPGSPGSFAADRAAVNQGK